MESEPEPIVKNPSRYFRNLFLGCLILGLIAVPISLLSEQRAFPDWSSTAFVIFGIAIAVSYSLFLSFLAVGCCLLLKRRPRWKVGLFMGILGGVPIILLWCGFMLIASSNPEALPDRIGFFSRFSVSAIVILLLVGTGVACVGWRTHLKSNAG